MSLDPDDALRQAAGALRHGELPWAEALCRAVLEKNPDNSPATALLKQIADLVRPTACLTGERFILIKSWGKGFWSDVDHVVGGLLLAEMTGRTPVIHWGPNCLFTAPGIDNAWPRYFEAINELAIDSVTGDDQTYFPSKWSASNLCEENLNLWQGPGSRVTNLSFLNRPETVVVADFHVSVAALVPWVETTSPLHGKSPAQLYRHLTQKHLRPQARIVEQVDAFHAKHLTGALYLAVHIRGADKHHEQRALAQINQRYTEQIDRLAPDTRWKIFLLTDDHSIADAMLSRYGERLIMTHSERSTDAIGVHSRPGEGVRRGEEVLIDTLLATRADRFVGNGASNVSAAVVHLKDWANDDLVLLAPIRQYRTMPVLYRPR